MLSHEEKTQQEHQTAKYGVGLYLFKISSCISALSYVSNCAIGNKKLNSTLSVNCIKINVSKCVPKEQKAHLEILIQSISFRYDKFQNAISLGLVKWQQLMKNDKF